MASLDFILDISETLEKQGIQYFLVCSQKNRAGEYINNSFISVEGVEQLNNMLESFKNDVTKLTETGKFLNKKNKKK
jgi:muconolactone delta-isomerase